MRSVLAFVSGSPCGREVGGLRVLPAIPTDAFRRTDMMGVA